MRRQRDGDNNEKETHIVTVHTFMVMLSIVFMPVVSATLEHEDTHGEVELYVKACQRVRAKDDGDRCHECVLWFAHLAWGRQTPRCWCGSRLLTVLQPWLRTGRLSSDALRNSNVGSRRVGPVVIIICVCKGTLKLS